MDGMAYSLDGEEFFDFDTIMDRINCDYEAGEAVIVEKGTTVPYHHRDFIRIKYLIEDIQEQAYDAAGEYADKYIDKLNITDEQSMELKNIIAEWLDKNVPKPTFFTVKNITNETIISEGC